MPLYGSFNMPAGRLIILYIVVFAGHINRLLLEDFGQVQCALTCPAQQQHRCGRGPGRAISWQAAAGV